MPIKTAEKKNQGSSWHQNTPYFKLLEPVKNVFFVLSNNTQEERNPFFSKTNDSFVFEK